MIFIIILGKLIYKFICIYGKNNNNCPLKFNQISNFHFHHWLIHLILIILLIYFKNYNEILLDLNMGGILHGILEYKDWYIIYKNK